LDAKVKATISGLLKNVKSFDFIVSLMFMKNIMFKTKILSEILQQEELNTVDALEMTKATVTSLERINNEETEMNDMIEAAVLYAKTSFQINAKEEITRSHRVRRIPRRNDENTQEVTAFTFYQYYTKEFKCVLDVLILQFRDKMQPTLDVIAPIAHALQVPLHKPLPEIIQKLAEMFPNDVDADISVAKDERTFSHLKFVKSVYRSTMGDKRLDNLMLLNCEKDLTDGLDMYQVVNQWASKRRC
jgi:hypothetical protein